MISELYLHSKSLAKTLSIAVMVDSFQLPAASRDVLSDIDRSDFAKLALVIVNQKVTQPSVPEPMSKWQRVADPVRRRSIIFDRFQRDNRRREYRPRATESVDCSDILGSSARFHVSPVAEGIVHRFPPEALTALKSYDLDVVIRLGFSPLCGEILDIARWGVWTFHYGVSELNSGGPTLFWEVFNEDACSEVSLHATTGEGDRVLCTSIFPTAPGYWPSKNLFQPLWGSTHQVIRKLNELHQFGWESLVKQAPIQPKGRTQTTPSNWEMVAWHSQHVGEELNIRYNRWRVRKTDQWRIGIRCADSPKLIAERPDDKSGFQWMPCPAGHYFADPMLYQHEGQLWIFFEDYSYGKSHGRICCAPVSPDGTFGSVNPCLDLNYHLSYPFVFQHDDQIFMIPESVAKGRVELWRATKFPLEWSLEKVLFKSLCVDTTPMFHEGRWYFFTSILSKLKTHAAFGALFYADSLTGEWVLHSASPISSDVRDTRPGGGVVRVEDRLLRPVQDCGERYGRRLQIDEILELTPDTYRARRLYSIEPEWEKDLEGIHTYGFCAGWEVVDAVRKRDRRRV